MITTDFVAKNQGVLSFKQRTATHVCTSTSGIVPIHCSQLDGRCISKNQFFYYQRRKHLLALFTLISL